jgi:hypothetical protein
VYVDQNWRLLHQRYLVLNIYDFRDKKYKRWYRLTRLESRGRRLLLKLFFHTAELIEKSELKYAVLQGRVVIASGDWLGNIGQAEVIPGIDAKTHGELIADAKGPGKIDGLGITFEIEGTAAVCFLGAEQKADLRTSFSMGSKRNFIGLENG